MNRTPDQLTGRPAARPLPPTVDTWLAALAGHGEIGRLLEAPAPLQAERGYGHTLREICQQPVTWSETANALAASPGALTAALSESGVSCREGTLVLTGSGSSYFAAASLALPLEEALSVPVSAVPAGVLLTHGRALPARGRLLLVSLARSGNSPESRAIVDRTLANAPEAQHLVITCNRAGALATAYDRVPGVRALVLDEKTDDRSLVMTSSFTNLVLAGQALGRLEALDAYLARSARLAAEALAILESSADALARTARSAYRSVVYLGSGCRLATAREAALKMLEMTSGRVWTLPETYLGLRHGPMSAVHADTLLVAFLSSSPLARAYELDLLQELERKGLGARRVVVGSGVPAEAAPGRDDVVVECGAAGDLADAELVLLDALVGQLLGFFRCLQLGLRPDAPSDDGVITRVVDNFRIHDGPSGPQP
ncbi:MAG: SIS domain-containing protein [Betaproteobacteria bacterium]